MHVSIELDLKVVVQSNALWAKIKIKNITHRRVDDKRTRLNYSIALRREEYRKHLHASEP